MFVCLAVPRAGSDVDGLVDAVRRAAPHAEIRAVWGGDQQLRPASPKGAPWCDIGLAEPSGVGWGRLSVALRADDYAIGRSLAAVERSAGSRPGVILVAGSVEITSDAIEAAVPASGVWRLPGGGVGIGFADAASADVDGLRSSILQSWHGLGDGTALETLVSQVADAACGVQSTAAEPPVPLRLPGGIVVDRQISALMAAAIAAHHERDEQLPPDPYGASPSEFLAWLETPWPPWEPDVGRYWVEQWCSRLDLQERFPEPELADRTAFREWCADAWATDGLSPLLDPTSRPRRPAWRRTGTSRDGINLIGYLATDNSIGDVARRIERSLARAGVPHRNLHHARTGSPDTTELIELHDGPAFETSLAVINGDSIPYLFADQGEALRAGRTIGYWFWELEAIPDDWVAAARQLDELWVATEYSATAFRAVLEIPVRVVEVPVAAPTASDRGRAEFDMPTDRFCFLVTFDHLSVTERKNPIGAVEAFQRAFSTPTADGPHLYVKTMNRSHREAAHQRVIEAAAGRSDITVVDAHLDRPDQMALLRHADCLVSLHRAEGLGLHLIEAMWLGTPVITTRYSGNLQFTDDDNAMLVDARMVPVSDGEGYLPDGAVWAEPDLDQAAAWMRRLVDEPGLSERFCAAGRSWAETQPTFAQAGAEIARAAGCVRGEK